jgi:hypothetical protein
VEFGPVAHPPHPATSGRLPFARDAERSGGAVKLFSPDQAHANGDLMGTFANALMALLGIAMFMNSVYMLYDPLAWYFLVPTIPATGPFNQHFLCDIGIAYLLVGAG